jgi:hypothetical protein
MAGRQRPFRSDHWLRSGNKFLKISDPLVLGERILAYATVRNDYPPNHGHCSDTFYTKSPR